MGHSEDRCCCSQNTSLNENALAESAENFSIGLILKFSIELDIKR